MSALKRLIISITIMGIQDENSKNSIKSKNYLKTLRPALKELEVLDIDCLVYCKL